ncbi:hypothetical protein PIB30_020289 [Stylosanthes scabra]|uniref:CCHC-type domain-containing protein n=1 Tax=Stylosanthes scabra TaxID=79078 RepID=A0ABU6V7E8_9FABA|nr:hypothetical protein [Stylosanthes scabra]
MTVLKLVDGLRVKIMMRFYTQFSCTSSNTRRISTIRCSNCKDLGHNRRGCQRAPVRAKKARQETLRSASQTSSVKETQQYASVQVKAKSQLQAKQTNKEG